MDRGKTSRRLHTESSAESKLRLESFPGGLSTKDEPRSPVTQGLVPRVKDDVFPLPSPYGKFAAIPRKAARLVLGRASPSAFPGRNTMVVWNRSGSVAAKPPRATPVRLPRGGSASVKRLCISPSSRRSSAGAVGPRTALESLPGVCRFRANPHLPALHEAWATFPSAEREYAGRGGRFGRFPAVFSRAAASDGTSGEVG